jgi:hypothetical protein
VNTLHWLISKYPVYSFATRLIAVNGSCTASILGVSFGNITLTAVGTLADSTTKGVAESKQYVKATVCDFVTVTPTAEAQF